MTNSLDSEMLERWIKWQVEFILTTQHKESIQESDKVGLLRKKKMVLRNTAVKIKEVL